MATVKPFRALRPAAAVAAEFASLPYDVMDTTEAREMVAQNPRSFLRVTRAEVDLPPETDPHAPAVYAQAGQKLAEYVADGLLRQDETACYYVYRQKMGDFVQTGLAAVCSVAEYEAGIVRRHELTRPDKEQDRVDHILATGAQTGPVFLVYRQDPVITAAVAKVTAGEPDYDFVAADGIAHTLWVMDDPAAVAAVEQAFAAKERLYIADGHHRAAAAARVSRLSGGREAGLFLTVLFPDNEVHILDYNRVIYDWGDLAGVEEFLNRIAAKFIVEPIRAKVANTGKPDRLHMFGMYLDGAWYRLTPKPGSFDHNDKLARLDVNILQNNLLGPILGIADPRIDKRIGFVGGIRGMAELRRLVDSGRAVVAFSLYPTSIGELMAVADAGDIMPPKSTWFEPKLRDGVVIHTLD
ncbi:MAG: DUF1015 domain-containing protein [Veillonellaceae bacterium]|nr:DUF1015 domain-containing protein [Veillonellaceae bacterium]